MKEGVGGFEVFHRGLRENIEQPNSLEAVYASNPGDVLELDIVLLKDGNIAMVHQKDIGKSLEELEDMSVSDFEKLDQPIKYTQNSEQNIKMPLMEEALAMASDRDSAAFLELKGSSDGKVVELADETLKTITEMKSSGAFKENPDFFKKIGFHTFSIEGAQHMISSLESAELDAPVYLEWTSSEKYAQDMEITKSTIPLAEQVTSTDNWIEKGMIIAKKIGCS